jgi:hypothetical protein
MVRRDSGPTRTESPDAYLRRTRALAALAVLALAGGVVSDALAASFWSDHALLAGLVASVIIVMLTVALVNEAVERRSRQRWRVLAQYVMLQLVRDARVVWTGFAELAGLMPADPHANDGEVHAAAAALEAASRAVRDTTRLSEGLRGLVAETDGRQRLYDRVALLVRHNDEVLGRWAAVMLNSDVYAEVIDRHVELAGDLAWLGSTLELQISDHPERARPGRGHPAALVAGPLDDEQLAQRMAVITQLAEQLDSGTLALALRIVPFDWWREQLGASAPTQSGEAESATPQPSRT